MLKWKKDKDECASWHSSEQSPGTGHQACDAEITHERESYEFKLWTQSCSETCKNVMRVFDLERAQNLGPKLVSSISQGSGSLSEHSALNTYQIKCLLPYGVFFRYHLRKINHLFRLCKSFCRTCRNGFWRLFLSHINLLVNVMPICQYFFRTYSCILCSEVELLIPFSLYFPNERLPLHRFRTGKTSYLTRMAETVTICEEIA